VIEALGPGAEVREGDVLVGGRARRGVTLTARPSDGRITGIGVVALVETEGEPPRVVACAAPELVACQARLDALARVRFRDLPPAGVRIESTITASIAGRPVPAFEGCKKSIAPTAGMVECSGAAVGWSDLGTTQGAEAQRDARVEDMVAHMREASSAGTPKRSTEACFVEDVPAQCSVARWGAISVVAGSAVVDGHNLVASCLSRSDVDQATCSPVLRLAPTH
jgi:hypothetical protein